MTVRDIQSNIKNPYTSEPSGVSLNFQKFYYERHKGSWITRKMKRKNLLRVFLAI